MIANIKDFFHDAKTDLDLLLIGLLIFTLPFERLPSVEVLGITIRASLVIGAVLITRVTYLLFTKKLKFKWNWLYIVLALFVGWIFLIVPESINIKRGLQIVIFNTYTIILCVAVSLIYKKEYLAKLVSLLLFSSALVAIFAIYQFIGDSIGLPGYLTGLSERYNSTLFGFPRVQAASLEPLYFGSYILLPIYITLAMFVWPNSGYKHKSLFGLLLLLSVSLFLTAGRGATYSLIVSFIVFLGITIYKKVSKPRVILGALCTLLAGFILAYLMINYASKIPLDVSKTFGKKGGEAFTQQLTNTGLSGSGDERSKARENALRILNDNKSAYILGVGPGQYGVYVNNNKPEQYGWAIVNNITLELLVETGLVGLGLILIFFTGICIWAIKSISNKGGKHTYQDIVLLGLVGYFASQALQYQSFSTLYIIHIWVAAGLLLGIVLNTKLSKGNKRV